MRSDSWTKRMVEDEKKRIREELGREYGGNRQKKVNRALQELLAIQAQKDSSALRLSAYVYSLTALVHHSETPVLKSSQVEVLLKGVQSLLRLQRIKPRHSPLSYLYMEFYQTLSLIFRRDGQLFRSYWASLMGQQLSGADQNESSGFTTFVEANRSLRLGHADLAFKAFTLALERPLSERQQALAALGQLRCLRLGGEKESFKAFAEVEPPHFRYVKHEWEWEKLTFDCVENGNFHPLVYRVRKEKEQYGASYAIEVFFWLKAVPAQTKVNYPKISSLAKYPELRMRQQKSWYRAALVIEECYDTEIPLQIRLDALGKVLSQTKKLLNVEQELLLWLAAARWLTRVRLSSMARLCVKQYESWSLRLSSGKNNDVLGLAEDLVTRNSKFLSIV